LGWQTVAILVDANAAYTDEFHECVKLIQKNETAETFMEFLQILSRLLNESRLIDALRVNQFKYNKIMHKYK